MTNNPKRVPYSDKVKARCREMRVQGFSDIQITGATGVPGSTIARWAAEGGWRVRDLQEEPRFSVPADGPAALHDRGGEAWGKTGSERPDAGAGTPADHTPRADGATGPPDEKPVPGKTRLQQLEDAVERASLAAEDAILSGNFAGAVKATQMADTLSKVLERLRNSAPEERPAGVFYTPEDISKAQDELIRRLDRLARTLRADEVRTPMDGTGRAAANG